MRSAPAPGVEFPVFHFLAYQAMKLLIGDKNDGSWPLRPRLLLKHVGIPFEAVCIELFAAGSKAATPVYDTCA
jgi:hypothetical protein